MTRVLLAVDGNCLIHRSFHANAATGFRDADGNPAWAIRGFLVQLAAAVDRVCADVLLVGFDDPDRSFRRERWPHYKAHRPDKLPALVEQLKSAVGVVRDLGVPAVVVGGMEADDVLAAAARHAAATGMRVVLATSDRDAFALVDENTDVLRVINGGVAGSPLLTPHRLRILTGVAPGQYRDLAALRGDPSDNLPGIRGLGAVRARKLLAEFGSVQAVFADIDSGGARCEAVLGASCTNALRHPSARADWRQNCTIMSPRSEVDLAPELIGAAGRLPLKPAAVRSIWQRYGIDPRAAVRALCFDATAAAQHSARERRPAERVSDPPVADAGSGEESGALPPEGSPEETPAAAGYGAAPTSPRRYPPLRRKPDAQLALF
ncbi:MAG: hypothetical protein CSA58_09950 [Micrococcales bacterium]|nr:MAG: hypothetical protein CSA58_09950 [Micrococcales bacterium]